MKIESTPNMGEKENIASYKKFNVSQHGGQQNKGDGTGQLQHWICGKENLRRD